MNMNQLLTHESESIATAMQSLKKANNWLSSFLESYSPPLDGERYLTDKELSEHLKLSRRTLQEYRKQRILPYIILCGKTLYPESEIQSLLTTNYRKLIKGICLLFSHLPTSHTTVRAVPHTAVSCFLILRCVASCFQLSL